MQYNMIAVVSSCFFLLHVASGVNLAVIEAGLRSSKAQILTNGFSICPTHFSPRGISIRCQGPDVRPPVTFRVNGRRVKREWFAPYTINGDFLGRSNKWNVLYGFVTLTCTTKKRGAKATVSGSFRCTPRKQLYHYTPSPTSLMISSVRSSSSASRMGLVRSARAPDGKGRLGDR